LTTIPASTTIRRRRLIPAAGVGGDGKLTSLGAGTLLVGLLLPATPLDDPAREAADELGRVQVETV
jgi:hypothetical protein